MCGRFASSTPVSVLAEQFLVEEVTIEAGPPEARYNVAPTDEVLAVAPSREGVRRLGSFRWGLVPSWAKDPSIGTRMINLRAETVTEKPSFRKALRTRRCVLPVDGFYEWKAMGPGRRKQPFFVRSRDGSPLALAGLWDVWRDHTRKDGPRLRTCTIITTSPNALVATVHDRMPVVLPREAWEVWLDPSCRDDAALAALLVPADESLLEMHPVSTEVNNVSNDGPQLVLPLEGHGAQ